MAPELTDRCSAAIARDQRWASGRADGDCVPMASVCQTHAIAWIALEAPATIRKVLLQWTARRGHLSPPSHGNGKSCRAWSVAGVPGRLPHYGNAKE